RPPSPPFFLSPSPPPPRHLHSFPTRRSSDLHPRHSVGGRRAQSRPRHDRGASPHLRGIAPGAADRGAGARSRQIQGRALSRPRQDRKSTRLNSSHLGISYAVFCLKKKRKTDR